MTSRRLMDVFSVELLDAPRSNRYATDTDMIGNDDSDVIRSRDNAADDAGLRPSRCLVRPRHRVFIASCLAAVGGVLFGYDTGTCVSVSVLKTLLSEQIAHQTPQTQ